MKKFMVFCVLLSIFSIGGIVVLLRGNSEPAPTVAGGSNVTVVDGKQTIQIQAKGGYAPRVSIAKANMPTVINMVTSGTFDCSSSVNIPSLGIRKNLPSSGETPIEIPAQPSGTILRVLCGMGMYSTTINFQ